MALVVKNLPANAEDTRDLDLIPGSARSPGGGNGNHAGRDWGQEEKGMTEDEMAGWHH